MRFFGGVIVLHHLWGMIISKAWGKTPRRNALFFDEDVRADRPGLVEEGRTTRTEEFRDVDGRCTDELVFAAHRDLVCGHETGQSRMGDRLRSGRRYDLPVLSDPPYPDESVGNIIERETRRGCPRRGRGRGRISRHGEGYGKGWAG